MEKGRYDGYDKVVLFGTVLEEKRRAYLFAPEDEGEGIWMAKSIVDWEDDDGDYEEDYVGDDEREGIMIMPKWLARKHKLIRQMPDDDHPAWGIILKPSRTFLAKEIVVVDNVSRLKPR